VNKPPHQAALIEAVAAAASAARPLNTVGLPEHIAATMSWIINIDAERERDVVRALESVPELAPLVGKMLCMPGVGVRCTPATLTNWLVQRAREVGAGRAVDDAMVAATVTTIPVRMVVVLSGVSTDERMQLADLALLPFADLPQSPQKTALSHVTGAAIPDDIRAPTAALVRVVEIPGDVYRGGDIGAIKADFGALYDAALVLTAVGPAAPVVRASWAELGPEIPWPPGAFGWGAPVLDITGGPTTKLTMELAAEAAEVITLFSRISGSLQRRLRIALERLNRAQRRASDVDVAIELGIALEALYLPDAQDELKFRLRVRASRLLGTSEEERRGIYEHVGQLYELRSKAVHTGALPDRIGARETKQVLRDGHSLVARSVSRLLRKGEPDWTRLITE
jgi:hypothetical protein